MFSVSLQQGDFDPGALEQELRGVGSDVGAIACFTGYVRRDLQRPQLSGLSIEHYPGMAEKCIQASMASAAQRWDVECAGVVHRIGPLGLGDRIVWVGVGSRHRAAAFFACEFIMDSLKTTAPLWKRELGLPGAPWVDAKERDMARAARWEKEQL